MLEDERCDTETARIVGLSSFISVELLTLARCGPDCLLAVIQPQCCVRVRSMSTPTFQQRVQAAIAPCGHTAG